MKQTINWGIMGTGWIAEKFCTALAAIEDRGAKIYAIGSRTKEKGEEFAARFGGEKVYGSYEELVADPDVDVIYVATPHRFHYENAKLCLENGKAVLCEKAFTVNAKEASDLARIAKEKGVFLMEAYWPRFQPLNRKLHKLLTEDRILGDIRMMQVDFDKIEDWPDEHRIYNPHLAGGTMLDLGIYTMSYSTYFLGTDIEDVHAAATIGKGGVDDQCAIVLKLKSGAISVQTAALQTDGRKEALFLGREGQLSVPHFYRSSEAVWTKKDGSTEAITAEPFLCNGYEFEALEVMDCIRQGKLESDIMPASESVLLMELLDKCRADYGFVYPFE